MRARLASAPIATIVDAVGDASTVVDVGCGHGLVSLALAARPGAPAVLGVDIDADKVAVARRAAASPPTLGTVEFRVVPPGWRPSPSAAIVVADVLYLMAPDEQAALVAACAEALAPGGVLVVKGMDDRSRWKVLFTQVQEQVAVRTVTARAGDALASPPARVVEAWLRRAGLTTHLTRHDARRPWPHYLVVGRRAATTRQR